MGLDMRHIQCMHRSGDRFQETCTSVFCSSGRRKPKSGQERDTSRCTKAARYMHKKMYNPRLTQSPRRQIKKMEVHKQIHNSSKREMYKEMHNPRLTQSTMLKLNPRSQVRTEKRCNKKGSKGQRERRKERDLEKQTQRHPFWEGVERQGKAQRQAVQELTLDHS